MNKKGFVFVETIIVIAVIMTILIMLYGSFISILNQERRDMTFDDVTYVYRTFYIEDFLVSLNLEQYIKDHLETPNSAGKMPLLATFTCHNDALYTLRDENGNNNPEEEDKKNFCEGLIDGGRLEVENIYITRYNVSDLVNCMNTDNSVICASNEELRNLSPGAVNYFRTLSGDEEDAYRLIIEYKTKIDKDEYESSDITLEKEHYLYSYSNIKIARRNVDDEE